MANLEVPHFPLATSSLFSQDDSAALIYREEQRLEGLQLFTERATLLRRLNAIRSAVRALPQELLSLIFRQAVHPTDKDDEMNEVFVPVILREVSTQWHDVVHATPQPWTNCIP